MWELIFYELSQYNLYRFLGPVQQILFFDDTPENLDTASRLGMQVVEVKSLQDVKESLESLRCI